MEMYEEELKVGPFEDKQGKIPMKTRLSSNDWSKYPDNKSFCNKQLPQ